jgi:hypothetical protein
VGREIEGEKMTNEEIAKLINEEFGKVPRYVFGGGSTPTGIYIFAEDLFKLRDSLLEKITKNDK